MSEAELFSLPAADGYELAYRRFAPPDGAAPVRVTVIVTGLPPTTDAGLAVMLFKDGLCPILYAPIARPMINMPMAHAIAMMPKVTLRTR